MLGNTQQRIGGELTDPQGCEMRQMQNVENDECSIYRLFRVEYVC